MTDIRVTDTDGGTTVDTDGTYLVSAFVPDVGHVQGSQQFFTAQIEIFQPGAAIDFAYGWGCSPWGTFSFLTAAAETTTAIFASDLGYRTESPAIPYPPLIQEAFAVDARVPLDPSQAQAVWGWGTLRIANAYRAFDGIMGSWNFDGRQIIIKRGVKEWDDRRGLYVDPPSSSLTTIFTGMSTPPTLSEFELQIPLRDPSYWLQRPVQRTVYAGTGTYEGDAELAGTSLPKTRGKVFNVPLVLIDRARLIYQYSDGPGTVQALYEGGATSITFQANTSDLYTGTTSPGQYRTDNSRGLIQLGSAPVKAITADVTGAFPVAGSITTAATIARYLMTEELLLPTANLAVSSFTTAATDYPYEAGVFFPAGDATDGVTAVMTVLRAFGAALVPNTSGELECMVLKAIPIGTTEEASFGTADISMDGLSQISLPASLSPPPRRLRCRYQHNYTVQTNDLGGTITDAQRQFVAQADRIAYWSSGAVALAYANANDPEPFGGALTTQADAQAVADRLGSLWGTVRFLFDVAVPVESGITLEFGAAVRLTYPNHALATGALGQVVGRSFRSSENTIVLTVLV